jgi:hypothetical protein
MYECTCSDGYTGVNCETDIMNVVLTHVKMEALVRTKLTCMSALVQMDTLE